jgi:hypothetical protein
VQANIFCTSAVFSNYFIELLLQQPGFMLNSPVINGNQPYFSRANFIIKMFIEVVGARWRRNVATKRIWE